MPIKSIMRKGMQRMGYKLVRKDLTYDDSPFYRSLYGNDSVDRKAFYNISCGGHFGFGGNFTHPLWTNIDVDREFPYPPQYSPELGIAYDPLIREELPLEDGSAELFHSRFAFEHIPDESALHVFREIYRSLKKGGVFRVIVPNIEMDYIAYNRNDKHYFSWIDNFSLPEMMDLMKYSTPMNRISLEQVFLLHLASNASPVHLDGADNPIGDEEFKEIIARNSFEQAMNLCTSRCSLEKQKKYRQNHINWWSQEKMSRFLQEAGFEKVMFFSMDQSMAPVMRNTPNIDPRLWCEVALFAEGIKK